MELRINLADREEIAAAAALLDTILNAAPASPGGYVGQAANTVAGQTDPAAAFAASPLAVAGAPSIAGAGLPPIVPGAMPGILPAMTGQQMPVAAAPGMAAPMVSAAATAPASNVPLDANGLPWDERIHAGTKGRNKDNTWTYKRGVDKALIPQIEAELRARVAAISSPGLPGPSMGYVEPQADPAAAFAASPVGGQPAASPDPQTFEQLMPRVSQAVAAKLMPPDAIGQACAMAGLASVVQLQQNPGFVPHVWATLKASFPALQ